jgi:hypothetical protein
LGRPDQHFFVAQTIAKARRLCSDSPARMVQDIESESDDIAGINRVADDVEQARLA